MRCYEGHFFIYFLKETQPCGRIFRKKGKNKSTIKKLWTKRSLKWTFGQ